MTNNAYRENHYVPQWYQRRFLPISGQQKFHYLDLKPEMFTDPKGRTRHKTALHRWGTKSCFKQTDLYTTRFGEFESTGTEQFFFGRVDDSGRNAIDYFTNFTHPSVNSEAFHALLLFMSVQKLRTPKGLAALAASVRLRDRNAVLFALRSLCDIHCAIWTESVWSLAEATDTETKFIISDHPVTVYNGDCFPGSAWCREFREPEIWRLGTHTLFPLSLTKIAIITNLAWVRNPYTDGKKLRPNPNPLRPAMFDFRTIQVGRKLTEIEVNKINFIIKRRAYRFIAAAKEEWLYPEDRIPSQHWRKIGEGYFLMPDPRSVGFSRETIIGYGNHRRPDIYDEYGREPENPAFKDEERANREWHTFLAFQGEFARLNGPKRKGLSFKLNHLADEEDSPDYHQYHLTLEKKYHRPSKYPRRGR